MRFEDSAILDLPHERSETITAFCALDVDFDGQPELFLGNYEGVVMCYKFDPAKRAYKIVLQLTLEDPIMSFSACDVYNVVFERGNHA